MTTTTHSTVDLQALKARHSLADFVEAAGIVLHGRGRVRQGFCPFHEDRSPSFTVYQDSQRFTCFGCGAMGDVLDFVQRTERVELPEAIRLLEGTPFPVKTPVRYRLRWMAPAACETPRDTGVLAAAARYYAAFLRRSREAQAYMRQRGITMATASALGLGYAPGRGLREHLTRADFGRDAIGRSGLFVEEGERFGGRVVVPEVAHGRVTWLTGRSIGAAEPRFQALPGAKPLLGRGRLANPRVVVLTEGLFDLLTLVEWGLPACATLGSHGLDRVASALATCRRIYVAMDADDTGREAAHHLAALFGPRAVAVSLPDGVKDVAELATHPRGRSLFLGSLKTAQRQV